MKILVIGETENLDELKKKFGESHAYTRIGDHWEAEKFIHANNIVFDFLIDENPFDFEIYAGKSIIVFLNTCKISLAELSSSVNVEISCPIFGFTGMPTFVNRNTLEVTLLNPSDASKLKEACESLGTSYQLVEDRVGLVTSRVVSMIINEAYYTVQEGTATREDIDIAMKLGTNYPYGPFEWCERIGIKHIYELLEAVYEDTKDERYKICPLLKKEYLKVI